MSIPDGLLLDVLVVDNASTDNSRDVVEEFVQRRLKRFRYVHEDRLGLSYARNRGLRTSTADVVAFLDDDAIPREDWLQATIDGYQSGDNIGAVGGQVLLAFPVGTRLPSWFRKPLYHYFSHREFGGDTLVESRTTVDDPYGANISFLRTLALSLGGFNVKLGRQGKKLLAGEETQLCKEIRESGYRVLLQPKSMVDHFIPPGRISLGYLAKQAWCDGQVASIWTVGEITGLNSAQTVRALVQRVGREIHQLLRWRREKDQLVIFFYQFIADLSAIYHRWCKHKNLKLSKLE